jgi:hypothetical protein
MAMYTGCICHICEAPHKDGKITAARRGASRKRRAVQRARNLHSGRKLLHFVVPAEKSQSKGPKPPLEEETAALPSARRKRRANQRA